MSNPFRPCRMVAGRVTAISAIDIPMFCFCQFVVENLYSTFVWLKVWEIEPYTFGLFLVQHLCFSQIIECIVKKHQTLHFFFPPPNFLQDKSQSLAQAGHGCLDSITGSFWICWEERFNPPFFSTDHARAMWVLEKQVRVRDGLISICLIFSDSVMMLM